MASSRLLGLALASRVALRGSVRRALSASVIAGRANSIRNFGASARTSGGVAPAAFDAIIVGGGPIGAALACALPGALGPSARVALIETRHVSPELPSVSALPSSRVIALSGSTVELLVELGVWSRLAARAAPFTAMRVWDASGGGAISFDAAAALGPGAREFGFVVEVGALESALYARLGEPDCASVVAIHAPASVRAVTLERPDAQSPERVGAAFSPTRAGGPVSAVRVALKDGTELTAPLIIGSDGPGSLVRTAAGLPMARLEYGLVGVVATLALDRASTTAWQRFLPSGPIALLPLYSPGGEAAPLGSLVWTVSREQADVLLAMDDAAFVRAVNAAFSETLDVLGVAPIASGTVGRQLVALAHGGVQVLGKAAAIGAALPSLAAVLPGLGARAPADGSSGAATLSGMGALLRVLDATLGPKASHYVANVRRGMRVRVSPPSSSSPPSPPTSATDDGHAAGARASGASMSNDQTPRATTLVAASRAAWPLATGHVTSYYGPRTVLVGDAAHQVHPLAGQGANLGFADVRSLAAILGDATRNGEDLGAEPVLARYQAARMPTNTMMMAGIHSLQRLFQANDPVVASARSLGLAAVNAIGPLKSAIASVAVGAASSATGSASGERRDSES